MEGENVKQEKEKKMITEAVRHDAAKKIIMLDNAIIKWKRFYFNTLKKGYQYDE